MKPTIRIYASLALLSLFLAGCASAPRHYGAHPYSYKDSVGGPGDLQAQTRGYAHSAPDYPGYDYRDILTDPGHF